MTLTEGLNRMATRAAIDAATTAPKRVPLSEGEMAWAIANGWMVSASFGPSGVCLPINDTNAPLIRVVLQTRIFQAMANAPIRGTSV
jgi:hypothetical protein